MLGKSFPGAQRSLPNRVPRVYLRQQCNNFNNNLIPVVHAFANGYQNDYARGGDATYERVLRYPDGLERRIRYPVPTDEASAMIDSNEEWPSSTPWDRTLSASTSQSRNICTKKSTPFAPQEVDLPDHIPNSPLALLRYLTSKPYKEAQKRELQKIKNSYEILTGCTWPVPKPLYILASCTLQDSDTSMTHTLRTRIPRTDLENELNKVLNRRNKKHNRSLSDQYEPLIRCSEIVDGVVAFEDDSDAERYGQLLEENGTLGVTVARCDSHELFRNVREAKGVVIYLKRGVEVPVPHKLAACLREQTSYDDDEEGADNYGGAFG